MLRVIDPRLAGDQDVVGVGDDLRPATLIWAYRHGIFPWPMPETPLLWFCPVERAVLQFANLHVPRRLARIRRQSPFTLTLDADFRGVITSCQNAQRPEGEGTWITPEIVNAYYALHRLGAAHSVEAWDDGGRLVGGLYGVDSGGVFTGESMFHAISNASKLALLHLIDHLAGRGCTWLDIQVMTPHMEVLGAALQSRNEFLDKLASEQERGLVLFG